jgi:hypothetical protein
MVVGFIGRHGENHQPVASHWQSLSHNVVLGIPGHKFTTFFRTVHVTVLIVQFICVCVILCIIYYLPRFSCNVKACSTIKMTIIPIHSKTKQNKILSRTVRLLHHKFTVLKYLVLISLCNINHGAFTVKKSKHLTIKPSIYTYWVMFVGLGLWWAVVVVIV